jgi:hypothetical protein
MTDDRDWRRGYLVVTEQTTLRELGSFVAQRIAEDVSAAERGGDPRAVSYAQWRRDLGAQFQRDVEERPWAQKEVGNFLRREAQLYRDHPEFRDWWA